MVKDKEELELRPQTLDDYVGQESIKATLRIEVLAAKSRSEPLDHALLYGPPGLGKTTLALILANEMGVKAKITSGPVLKTPADLMPTLFSLENNDILFIDEIHRMTKVVEETIYPAMEDRQVDIMLDSGSRRVKLPPFTLLGATTRYAMLSAPLRDRFGTVYRLNYYTQDELALIIRRSASVFKMPIEESAVHEIASRSRGTPRIANRILRRVRNYAEVMTGATITADGADKALAMLGIDDLGLDEVDYKILHCIIDKFKGGPVGLGTVADAISEEEDTIMDVYEPYLLQLGFLDRTPRGRIATPGAYEHLAKEKANVLRA